MQENRAVKTPRPTSGRDNAQERGEGIRGEKLLVRDV
jgi:hypothetical protein